MSLAEAVAVLLQTWNSSYYRYHRFDRVHLSEIEALLSVHARAVAEFAGRSLPSLREQDHGTVARLFNEFDLILGPVGAAKALHLLAPEVFPLWDRAIARAYRLPLRHRGKNSDRYVYFMTIAKEHLSSMYGCRACPDGSLKAWDEFNYCRFTKQWM